MMKLMLLPDPIPRGRIPFAVSLALLACGLAFPLHVRAQPNPLQALQEALTEAIERAEPSVVSLAVHHAAPEAPLPLDADPFDFLVRGDPPVRLPSRFGSGVIIKVLEPENVAFVLTNEHLVEQKREQPPRSRHIAVRLAGRQTLRARVHAADPRSDLAVLRVDLEGAGLKAGDLRPAEMGDADRLKKGSLVLALGNAYALARDGSASASLGMIGNLSRAPLRREGNDPAGDQIHALGTLLHIDANLDLGTSGGALIGLDGRLVGLTTSLAAIEGYEKAAGFAIPMTPHVQRIVTALLHGYEVEYGFLGVTPDTTQPEELAEIREFVSQPSAARVNRVAAASPADRGGLRPEDLVLRVNGRAIYQGEDLIREVGLIGPGNEAALSVYRPRTRTFEDLTVTLGKWPVYDDSGIVATADRHPRWRGLEVDYPTGRRRYLTSAYLREYHRAVVITEVIHDSPAARAGLRVGQFVTKVAGRPVETPDQFHAPLQKATGTVTLTLLEGTEVDIAEPSP